MDIGRVDQQVFGQLECAFGQKDGGSRFHTVQCRLQFFDGGQTALATSCWR